MPIIDAHTHLFPPDVIKQRRAIAEKDRPFSLLYDDERSPMVDYEGLVAYMSDEEIEKAVCLPFPFADPGLVGLCNDYILEAASADRRMIPFAMVDLENGAQALAEAERCFAAGAKGIGEIAFYYQGFHRREREALDELAAYMEEKNLILMLHLNEQVGHRYKGKTEIDFGEVVRFVECHPGLRIIFAHLGGGLCFYEFMPEIKKCFESISYDSAAIPYLYSKEVYPFIERFLPEKVLFGSDYPLLSVRRYRADADGLSGNARERFFYENARRLFGPR
jgi:uncharacterized protein